MDDRISRRSALRAGVVVALTAGAGCLGSEPGTDDPPIRTPTTQGSTATPTEGSTVTPTERGTPTTTRTASRELSFVDPTVQTGLVYLFHDAIGVTRGKYFALKVRADDGGRPPREEFELSLDGERYEPHEPRSGPQYRISGVIFKLPTTAGSPDARLHWPSGEWTPPEDPRPRPAGAGPQHHGERVVTCPPDANSRGRRADVPVDAELPSGVPLPTEGRTIGETFRRRLHWRRVVERPHYTPRRESHRRSERLASRRVFALTPP